VTVPARERSSNGAIHLVDARSAKTYAGREHSGELTLEAIKGPFSFEGQTDFSGSTYSVHVGSGGSMLRAVRRLGLLVQSSADVRRSKPTACCRRGRTMSARSNIACRHRPEKRASRLTRDVVTYYHRGQARCGDGSRRAVRLYGAARREPADDAADRHGRTQDRCDADIQCHDRRRRCHPAAARCDQGADRPSVRADPAARRVAAADGARPIAGMIGLDVSELNLRAVSLRGVHVDC